ncbi:MAG: glucosyltransferase [Bathelium mastoideum]|nr:MAG: glucosyltransferase [Bathelium mastoideum]
MTSDQSRKSGQHISLALLTTPVVLAVASGFWLQRISAIVPKPYLDEVFHVRQAQAYCAGRYLQWDPKITTPPGLYMLSAAFSTLFNRCDIKTLRALNVVGILGIFFQAFGLHLRRKRQDEPIGERMLVKGDDDASYLQRIYDTHTSLNLALFPPLFFFSALYYTDVLSTLYVMISFDLYLRTSATRSISLRSSMEIVISGLLALSCRQTNIFWVAVFPAGLTAVRALKTTRQQTNSSSEDSALIFSECVTAAWTSGYVYDGPVSGAQLMDYVKAAVTLVIAAVRSPHVLVSAVWPYVVLVGLFGVFVVWNGGVVLGDKSNHIATIHLPQLLYIWPYVFFFSAPLVYPYLIRLLRPVMPLMMRRALQRVPGAGAASSLTPHWSMLFLGLGSFSLLASVIVHFNTIIHPFTLADNRHYVFYVFRILRRPYVRYLATPVYGICAWACIEALGGNGSPAVDPSGERKTKTAPRMKYEGCETSFVIIWLITCALTLCSAPLVEPRYFILPWIMWRLHVPPQLPVRDSSTSKNGSRESKDSSDNGAWSSIKRFCLGYDHRLSMETIWFLVVNGVTGYMFLYRGFEWPQEPASVQRFMW